MNNFVQDDDDLDDLNLIIYGIPRRIYHRNEYFNSWDDLTFFSRFRVTKPTSLYILNLIEAEIEHPYDFNNSVAPMNQLLIFLRLCATGTHLSCVADFGGTHLSTVSRIVKRVGRALASKSRRFICMPERLQDITRGQFDFYEIARFPRVIGAVDGTHIRIQSPGGEDAEVFRNRKGYFSMNVQTYIVRR
ncbi:hypothetical protein JTB14_001733 [Gonioctena quinquepunctata]|nr:hypothetical protein JTB14_001733 [Gonioctena quinquepunctata]